jgi:RES domain-containing protein
VRVDVPGNLLEEALDTGLDVQDDDACASFGTEWIRTEATPAIEAPSVIVPTEKNLLLNPKHARFGEITVSVPKPFRFDPRLLKPGPVPAM